MFYYHVLDGWHLSINVVLRSANFFSTFSKSLPFLAAPPDTAAEDRRDVSFVTELIDIIWDEVDRGGCAVCLYVPDAAYTGEPVVTAGESALTTAPTALALLIFCV